MKRIMAIGLICAFIMSIFAMGTTIAVEYDGYREHIYARYGTANVDGMFTTSDEYGTNEYSNPSRTSYYVNESTAGEKYTAGLFSIYVMNDDVNIYFIYDFGYANTTDYGTGLVLHLDLNKNYSADSEDASIWLVYSSFPGADSISINYGGEIHPIPLNATSFGSSPNVYYNHSIIEFGINMDLIGVKPGDNIPFVTFVGDDYDPYASIPNDVIFMGAEKYGNITLASVPEIVEIDSWTIFETPNYGFGSDAFISVSTNINISIDYQKDIVTEVSTHWFVATTYRVNIDLSNYDVTDCTIDIIMNYKDVVKKIDGYFPDASIMIWLDDAKYQIVSDTSIVIFDENLGSDGGYTIIIDEDVNVKMIEVVVNCAFRDYWHNLMTKNMK